MVKTYIDIGKRLREIRVSSAEYSSKQAMAEMLNITVEHYDSLERAKYLPNVEMLITMTRHNQDIDYILTGNRSTESVFSEIFIELNNNEKNEVGKLLLYKMKLLNNGSIEDCVVETKIRTYKNVEISPYERVRDLLEQENNCRKMSNYEIARQLGISERTVNRLNKGESLLNTDIILNIYNKYSYFPSYVLCGEINSNSKIDQVYAASDKTVKETLIKCARELAAYCKAGKIYENCHM